MMPLMKNAVFALLVGTHLLIAWVHVRNYVWPPKPYGRRITSLLFAGIAASSAAFAARLVGWVPHWATVVPLAMAATCGTFACVVLFHTGGRR